jgi:hypothetical protein
MEVLKLQAGMQRETKHALLFCAVHGVMIESGMVPEMDNPCKYFMLPEWQLRNGDFKVSYKLAAAPNAKYDSRGTSCVLKGHAMGRFLVVYGMVVTSDETSRTAGRQVVYRVCLDSAEFVSIDAERAGIRAEQAAVAASRSTLNSPSSTVHAQGKSP